MRKSTAVLMSTLAISATVFAGATVAQAADMKAACILGVGGRGDQGYNDLAFAGMEQAQEELGVEFDFAEPKQVTEFEPIMRDLCDSGEYGVIVCIGFDQQAALETVCADYPEQHFAIIDATVEADNVVSYASQEHEGSYLVGALAAMMKQDAETYGLQDNHQLGFVGAMETPLIVKFAAGFEAGAKSIDPETVVDIQYVGGDNPFSDTTTAKEIATNQFENGYDIVFHAAGGSGLGVFTAAAESNFIAIGCNSNQNVIDPDHIVASMLKRVDTAAFDIVKNEAEGTLKVGETVILGVAQDGVGYTVEGTNIPVSDEMIAALEEIRASIANGEIEIPQELN